MFQIKEALAWKPLILKTYGICDICVFVLERILALHNLVLYEGKGIRKVSQLAMETAGRTWSTK